MASPIRKSEFVTADWHVGHERCILFDQRPFNNLDQMHNALIKRYNSVVPVDGVCYFLGDMAWDQKVLKEILTKLNGTKVLVLGNHDKRRQSMYGVGFDVVLHNLTVYIANEEVTMSHCPLRGVFREDTSEMRNSKPGEAWHGEFRHQEFSIENHGQFHLHGHIHSSKSNNKPKINDKQFDVGTPANNYTPVSFSQIESFIMKYKNGTLD